MKTINERAIEAYPNITAENVNEVLIARKAYIKGAIEQNKIDDLNMLYLADSCEHDKKLLIDKACEWMKSHINEGLVIYHNNTWCSLGEFIKNFRKSMEGE